MLTKTIKAKFASITAILYLLVSFSAAPLPVFACTTDNSPKGQVEQSVAQTAGASTDCTGSGVTTIVGNAIQLFSIIIGIAAVVMIMIAGFKYITANGDSNNINSAKSTLVYALIGVAIAALAQFLVHFVFNTVTSGAP